MPNIYSPNFIVVGSPVILIEIPLALHVDQFVTIMFTLVVSSSVMQQCRDYWDVKNDQR